MESVMPASRGQDVESHANPDGEGMESHLRGRRRRVPPFHFQWPILALFPGGRSSDGQGFLARAASPGGMSGDPLMRPSLSALAAAPRFGMTDMAYPMRGTDGGAGLTRQACCPPNGPGPRTRDERSDWVAELPGCPFAPWARVA